MKLFKTLVALVAAAGAALALIALGAQSADPAADSEVLTLGKSNPSPGLEVHLS